MTKETKPKEKAVTKETKPKEKAVTKETKPKEKAVTKEKSAKKATHRMWLYKGKEARIFDEGDAIPSGYKETPAESK